MNSSVNQGRSFAFRLPLPHKFFRFGKLVRGHPCGEPIPHEGSKRSSMCCLQLIPHVSLDIVLRHAIPAFIQEAKSSLRSIVSSICSSTIPSHGHHGPGPRHAP
jgi:hypothetical protein